MSAQNKISVTIVTGFLGAGKTTFINHFLKSYPEKQFALVENEFGEVSIDSRLIKGMDVSRMFELKNGCICCALTDEYELVLQELADRFPHVEHLVIETTGIADPIAVIRPFYRDENLKRIYQFSGTVCLVDGKNSDIQLNNTVAVKQVTIADVVLINKTEKFQDEQKERLKKYISRMNPFCEIQFAEFGISKLFQLGQINNHLKFIPDFQQNEKLHAVISAQTVFFTQPLDRERFVDWLTYTMDIYRNRIYRVKGILYFENEPYEYILQGVGGSFELKEGENLSEGKRSEMIFIGELKGIKIEFLH